MKIFYRLLQILTAGAAAVLLWFFVVGLGDGTVDSANILLWLVLIGIPIGALWLGKWLWSRGDRIAASIILALPAAPALVYGLFVALIVILQPDFR
jgi:ABC-type phosphate transport system permease subunit